MLKTSGQHVDEIKKSFTFRFYAELNDFLPEHHKQVAFSYCFKTPVTVRETIESFGIPLSEVDLILINGQPADLKTQLSQDDYISIYPVFESMDIGPVTRVRKKALRNTLFILDAHLGKLAKYLRMLGFDTLYRNDYVDDEIIAIARKEDRIILTRDKLLLKSEAISHGYYVRAVDKHQQLTEVVQKFDLISQFKSFTRCMTCNATLIPKTKSEIKDNIDDETAYVFNEFYYCPFCDKVFWKGSHFERMEAYIKSLAYK